MENMHTDVRLYNVKVFVLLLLAVGVHHPS